MKPLKKIAFIINTTKPEALELGETLMEYSSKLGVEAKLCDEYPLEDGFLEDQDACCVVGGDGTILGVVEQAVDYQVPVFGINQGKLGFLATFSKAEALESWERLLAGDYRVEHRSLLECRAQGEVYRVALNDIVIKNASASRLIELELSSAEGLIAQYSCDGLIIATPTGSTAYNLSAGGPIVHPSTKSTVITPICAHTLSNRSVVLAGSMTIRVTYKNPQQVEPQVTIDGRVLEVKDIHAPVEISLSQKVFPLLRFSRDNYLDTVRKKLKWGA